MIALVFIDTTNATNERASCCSQARLVDGRSVAVKIQRPEVLARLELDAHVMRLVAQCYQRVQPARHDAVAIADELIGRIFEEVIYLFFHCDSVPNADPQRA